VGIACKTVALSALSHTALAGKAAAAGPLKDAASNNVAPARRAKQALATRKRLLIVPVVFNVTPILT
jgi:hypothetical protein